MMNWVDVLSSEMKARSHCNFKGPSWARAVRWVSCDKVGGTGCPLMARSVSAVIWAGRKYLYRAASALTTTG